MTADLIGLVKAGDEYAFRQLIGGLAQFEGGPRSGPGLYRVATNYCLKALRSASRRAPVD